MIWAKNVHFYTRPIIFRFKINERKDKNLVFVRHNEWIFDRCPSVNIGFCIPTIVSLIIFFLFFRRKYPIDDMKSKRKRSSSTEGSTLDSSPMKLLSNKPSNSLTVTERIEGTSKRELLIQLPAHISISTEVIERYLQEKFFHFNGDPRENHRTRTVSSTRSNDWIFLFPGRIDGKLIRFHLELTNTNISFCF